MHKGYCSHSVCVCYHASCCILFCKPQVRCYKVPYAVSNECIMWIFSENAFFSSFGVIYLLPLPSTLPEEFSMNRTNNSGLLSRYKVYRFSDSSCRTTTAVSEVTAKLLDFSLNYTVNSVSARHTYSIYSFNVAHILS